MTDEHLRTAGFLSALTDEQRILVGECVAQAALLEGLLRTAVMTLASPEAQSEPILRLISGESALSLDAKARIFLADLPGESRARWKQWLDRTRLALEERNLLAHTSWVMGQDDLLVGRRQRRGVIGETRHLEDGALMRMRTHLIQARVDGHKLIRELQMSGRVTTDVTTDGGAR